MVQHAYMKRQLLNPMKKSRYRTRLLSTWMDEHKVLRNKQGLVWLQTTIIGSWPATLLSREIDVILKMVSDKFAVDCKQDILKWKSQTQVEDVHRHCIGTFVRHALNRRKRNWYRRRCAHGWRCFLI